MKRIIFICALMLLGCLIRAEIRLPSVISDGMVLQRNTSVKLWGKAKENTKVRIQTSWDSKKYITTSDSDGYWIIEVTTSEAGGPYEILFSDGEKKVVSDILLGEVWICGGQSNMEMPIGGYMHQPVRNAIEHIKDAYAYPQIRLMTVPRIGRSGKDKSPYGDMPYEWRKPTPESVRDFSAIGYIFAKNVTACLGGVPVGLISANWGGSDISSWMSLESLRTTPDIDLELAMSGREDNTAPASLFDNMIRPLIPFKIKGILWYQGEQNRYNWFDYKSLLVSMVKCWREEWGDAQMYFYQVQLAPFGYDGNSFRSIGLMNEAQYKASQEISNSGIVASVDVGERTCIHASEKEVLAERLSWLALSKTYGIIGFPMPSPVYKSMKIISDQSRGKVALLDFYNVSDIWNESNSFNLYESGEGLVPDGFEIAGEDRVFYKANARFIWGNKIEVWCKEVADPVAVRYAFMNWCPEANVVTTQGQPLMPFRTDEWPVTDVFKGK